MPPLRPLLVGLTAASLLAFPGAAAAQAPAPVAAGQALGAKFETRVVWRHFDHTRAFASATEIRGQVLSDHGLGWGSLRGVRVELLRRLDGRTAWKSLGFDRTGEGSHPKFEFRVRTKANASYRVVFDGNAEHEASRNTTHVSAYRKFNAELEDGSGRFHGRMQPKYAHKKVYLQKRRCPDCAYKTVDKTRTTGKSRYSFTVGAPRRGQWWWRAKVPGTTKFITSYSGVFSTSRG